MIDGVGGLCAGEGWPQHGQGDGGKGVSHDDRLRLAPLNYTMPGNLTSEGCPLLEPPGGRRGGAAVLEYFT